MATPLNIVVVEDHDALREAMVDFLQCEGHHVRGLGCAEALDAALMDGPMDLLIVDLQLPGEDGYSLTQRLRETHPLAGIIMVTARHQLSDKVTGFNSGADLYLVKPVAPAELSAAVDGIARRLLALSRRAEISALATIRLDSRTLTLNGPLGACGVTEAEAFILTALARAPGNALEIWQLFELLKLDLDQHNRSAFEVRIVRLRQKLRQVGADTTALKVVRKRGYQLRCPLVVY